MKSCHFRIHCEHVSATPYRLNVARIFGIRFDFFAQPADVVVDAAVKEVGVASFGQVEQLIAGEGDFRPFKKGRQEPEFAARKGDGHAAMVDQLALTGVQRPLAEADAFGLGRFLAGWERLSPAEDSGDASYELPGA